jgi:hypothetical protein
MRVMNKKQTPTIRLDLTAEEYTAFKVWCAANHVFMGELLSKLARKAMRTKIITPTESASSDVSIE